MDLGIRDRVAFVAGSSRGIGRAIAESFLNEGARVVLTGRDVASLDASAREMLERAGKDRVLVCPGDLSDPGPLSQTVRRVQDHFGRVDFLVANVGSGTAKSGWKLDLSDWEGVFRTNLWTSVRVVEAFLPMMTAATGSGSIVFISSIVGLESVNAPLPYSAAKAALINYSKNLSRLLAEYSIRVNCVAPGNVLFDGGSWHQKLVRDSQRVNEYLEKEVPLRRFGQPAEIADLVVFLCSDRASFITGSCFLADGGQTRRI